MVTTWASDQSSSSDLGATPDKLQTLCLCRGIASGNVFTVRLPYRWAKPNVETAAEELRRSPCPKRMLWLYCTPHPAKDFYGLQNGMTSYRASAWSPAARSRFHLAILSGRFVGFSRRLRGSTCSQYVFNETFNIHNTRAYGLVV